MTSCVGWSYISDGALKCSLNLSPKVLNLVLNLDGYIWAISSLASDRIQVCFLEEIHLESIVPAVTLIYIGNGCESHSTNIYIPSKTDLTSEIDMPSGCNFFVGFNVIYQNIM